MRRLLAVGVLDSWIGDWQITQGNELSIAAAPIREGERVYLEVDSGDSVEQIVLSDTPFFLHLPRESRYRVLINQDCSGAAERIATTVEAILSNGSPSP